MRGIRTVGLCVVAVFAMACALASSASAALPTPYWAACAKTSPKDTGKYKNKTCTESEPSGKGAYELKESIGKGKAFKGGTAKAKKGEKLIVIHLKNPKTGDLAKVECTSAKDTGKPELPNFEKEVSITYSSCEAIGKICKSVGAKKAGEIKITGLKGELGYVEEAPEVVVGLKLENEKEPGKLLSEFDCGEPGEVVAKVTGEVIGVQSKDVNAVSKESGLLDAATERYGEHEFEGTKFKPLVNILGWAEELAGIEEAQMKNEEETDPAHVLRGEFCGTYVESLLKKECIESVYLGLDQTITNKGEDLMVKT